MELDESFVRTGVVGTYCGQSTAGYRDAQQSSLSLFQYPFDCCTDAAGNLYIADSHEHRVRKVSANGEVSTLCGAGSVGFRDGPKHQATFDRPYGLCCTSDGVVFVADRNHAIRRVEPSGQVTTIAGAGERGFVDGVALEARFNQPGGLDIDAQGNILVCDSSNSCIRQISTDGRVCTLVGSPDNVGFADGPISSASFRCPSSLVVASDGTIFVADLSNRRIRGISADRKQVFTIAGSGEKMHRDGSGLDSAFERPTDVALAFAERVLFVSDRTLLRAILLDDGNKVITVCGGSSGYSDGSVADEEVQFNHLYGLAVDSERSRLYICDSPNYRVRVLMHRALPSPKSTLAPDCISYFSALLEEQRWCDVSFSVNRETVGAHKLILAARSEYFRKMLSNGFRESTEPHPEIPIVGYSALSFRMMLTWIYSDQLPVDPNDLSVLFEVLALSDQYALDNLYANCEKLLLSALCVSNAILIYERSAPFTDRRLHNWTLQYILSNWPKIEELHSGALEELPEELRYQLREHVRFHPASSQEESHRGMEQAA